MHVRREAVVGGSTFLAFFAGAVAVGSSLGVPALRVYSFLFGLGGGGACAVFAALAAHLAGSPAAYEPIEGGGSAWGLAEFEDAGGEPPR